MLGVCHTLSPLPPPSPSRPHWLASFWQCDVTAVLMVTYKVLQKSRMIHASRTLHCRMLRSLLHTPIRFFDTTPLGRIVSRFSRDINCVDEDLHDSISGTVEATCQVASCLFVITYSTPWFLVALVPLFVVYLFIQVRGFYFIYIYIQRERERERESLKASSQFLFLLC